MPETLSQSQIDELLSRMRSGQVEEAAAAEEKGPKVKEYDFTLPKKFTRDQLKMLRSLSEPFARQMSSYLTGILREVCEVSISQIEEQRFGEFSNAMEENVFGGLLLCRPMNKDFGDMTMVLDFSASFGFLVIERLLGGSGKPETPDREYTDIERALLRTILQRITSDLQLAWNNLFEADISLQDIETSSRMLQTFAPQDAVVILSLDIMTGVGDSMANLCIPANELEEIMNSLGAKAIGQERQLDGEKERIRREALLDGIQQGNLQMVAYLDRCKMALTDILRLQEGDVISLGRKINEDIEVDVDGRAWYSARLGELDTQKALKLIRTIPQKLAPSVPAQKMKGEQPDE